MLTYFKSVLLKSRLLHANPMRSVIIRSTPEQMEQFESMKEHIFDAEQTSQEQPDF